MRRLPLLLLPAILSAGLIISCNESKPNASSGSETGTRKLIPANMMGETASLNGSGGGAANAGGTRVVNPNAAYTGNSLESPGSLNTPGRYGAPESIGAAGGTTPTAAARPQQTATPAIDTADLPDAPAGSQWTLYCQSISGPGHLERANDVKRQLISSTSMKSWYVIHGGDSSNLYYGFYKSIDSSDRSADRKAGQQAQNDRKRIDGMKDANGDRPFARCMFVELAAPDPQAPANWNLANTSNDMAWSVQIAAYQHHPDRKKYAVDSVREARSRGVEAYFFHGPTTSSVCIGAWPMSAVRFGIGRGMAGDPNKGVLMLPEGLPPIKPVIEDDQGKAMQVAEKTVEIVDPTLTATLLKYPEHSINGTVRMIKGKNRQQQEFTRPEPSFMVRIPNRYIEGERTGDPVNPDAQDVNDPGVNWLSPRNQPRQPSKLDYIPKPKR